MQPCAVDSKAAILRQGARHGQMEQRRVNMVPAAIRRLGQRCWIDPIAE